MKLRSPGEKPVIRAAEEPLLKRLVERFTPTGSGAGASALTETLALPLLALALAFWLNPLDPFFLASQFAWVWLGPVLVALRYGPLPGLAGSAIVFAAWFVFGELGVALGALPKLYFLGWLITVMICGEFSSLWRSRVRRAESVQGYLEQRLEYLTHQHYLLRLSHDRLEQDLISRPVSMRDALVGLRALSSDMSMAGTRLPGGAELLRLVAQYCQIERAALIAVDDEIESDGSPAVHLGAAFDFDADDSLIGFVREHRRLGHIALDDERAQSGSRYLVVAPLTDMRGSMHALLVVQDMPFFALHDETLQMLNLLLGYYADGLSASELAAPLRGDHPDCPLDFAFELSRMWRVRVDSGVASALVVLEFPDNAEDDLATQISRIQRSLDIVWRVPHASGARLITLMPLAGSAAIEGYLARIDTWLKQHRSGGLDISGVGHRSFMLNDTPPSALLARILKVRHGS
ncbi:MAG: PelD GGDEF domain-containing protein [Methyloversatilis sp.]|jgi:hypothetical protein|nr:PelD GGDEF domain-containing protein [Methyloversatilis sp.]MBP6193353.1 PelD GGDEF domain-containing protein [Methyloversatilis sp.]MBP9117933.1 PelD GGDEF domain-containing protein [Methyloversatilis sp.]